jgi:YidC/Oxa1 family membrane protein insertase
MLSQLTRARLEPELVELRRRHANDPQRLASETAALFRAHRVSPYSSCLSSLLPAPIYLSAYEVIRGLTHRAGGSALFQPRYLPHASRLFHSLTATTTMKLWGVDLARTGVVGMQVSPLSAGVFLGLVAILVTAGVWQQHLVRSAMPQSAERGSAAGQRAARILPALFAIWGLALPVGVTLYYASMSVARLAQQWVSIRGHPW